MKSLLGSILFLCLVFPSMLFTQEKAASAKIMVLGMYHFANPGKDAVKTKAADILTDEGQKQLEDVLTRLESFRPTKIAIEALPAAQQTFDSLYAAYREGKHTLTRNERQQVGFQLAKRRGLDRLYCIDHSADLPFESYLTYAEKHAPDVVKDFEGTIARYTVLFDSLHQHATVLQILQLMNTPSWMAESHGLYVTMARLGTPEEDVGPDVISTWYDRNIRIFGNLARIVEPHDRVLVIYGGGHSTILRDLVKAHHSMDLVDPLEYLK